MSPSIARRVLKLCQLIAICSVIGFGLPSISVAGGKSQQAPGNDNEVCDHLPDPPGNANGIHKKCPDAGSSSGITKGDFNGDGFADLAIGVPGKDASASVKDSGAVLVIYGSANGLTATDPTIPASQLWTENSPGVPGTSASGDRFGSALASGDFNKDGFTDLAIGVPGRVVIKAGRGSQGSIVVIYGSASGLSTDPATRVLAAQSFSIIDISDPNDQLVAFAANVPNDVPTNLDSFGSALAWGDFNHDGAGDLAVGAPKSIVDFSTFSHSQQVAGSVSILLGTPTLGLVTDASQLWTQRDGLAGNPNEGDRFGASLTSGDFDGNGFSDLAVGIPGKTFGSISSGGEVCVIYGSNASLTAAGNQLWDRLTVGVSGTAHSGDQFGWSLAAGDFNGDGRAELAVGVPFDDTIKSSGGSVQVFSGAAGGLTSTGNTILTQNSLFANTLATEAGDGFGYAVAAGDFNGDGRKDLAIGVPFQDFFNTSNAGEVDVIYGSSTGLARSAGPGPQSWHQSFGGVTTLGGNADTGDEFGLALSAWNFGRNQFIPGTITTPPHVATADDLAVGVPFELLFSHVDHVTPVADAGAVNVVYGSLSGLALSGNQFWTLDSAGVPGDAEAGDTLGLALY